MLSASEIKREVNIGPRISSALRNHGQQVINPIEIRSWNGISVKLWFCQYKCILHVDTDESMEKNQDGN